MTRPPRRRKRPQWAGSRASSAKEGARFSATPGIVDGEGTIRWAVNLAWTDLPLGQRLKNRNKAEVAKLSLAVEGVLAVQAGDNPRVVREKLEAFLSPAQRRDPEAAGGGAQGAGSEPVAAAA